MRGEREGKGGKVREGSKTSDVKRRGGGQMREGSSRAGKGCEARERANGGPCFTNCHLRGANGGMRNEKKNTTTTDRLQIAHSERCTQAHMVGYTHKHR